MSLQLSHISHSFGPQEVLNDINLEIKGNPKIALIGRNGSGKTTLFKIIIKELMAEKGDLTMPRDYKIASLAQVTFEDENQSVKDMLESLFTPILDLEKAIEKITHQLKHNVDDALLDKYTSLQSQYELLGGYTYRQEMMNVFTRFGFSESDLSRSLSIFSSGQKTRLAFVRLLLSKPDLLLLDEPTNHLDMATIEWLETYLNHYQKAILFISHDRMFIDNVADVIYELEYTNLTYYPGNYSQYLILKNQNQEKQLSAYKRQQKDIQRLEELIEKFRYKRSKAKFAQSKIKYLDRMDKIEKPTADTKNFKAYFHSRVKGGKQVLKCDQLMIGYDKVLAKIDLTLMHGQRCAIIGPNGQGKTTFLKTIMGYIPSLSGEYLMGHQIECGYFDQELIEYKNDKTVLEELWDGYPELTHTEVRTILGQFLFTAEEVFKSVRVLSGGEKVRLSLAKLLLQQPNFLVLDEPTNHLDVLGKESLENALMNYDGTILFVSHDRYFIQKMANCVLSIENQACTFYNIDYHTYAEQKIDQIESKSSDEQIKERSISIGRLQKQLKKLEDGISEKELSLQALREKRFEPEYYHDHKNMQSLDDQIDEAHNQITHLMKQWEELSEIINNYGDDERKKV